MKDKKARTHFEAAQIASEVFQQNLNTLIAGFLIRNPHINPGDIWLTQQTTKDGIRFCVEAKELHVPDEAEYGTDILGTPMSDDWVNGWNACRAAVIGMKARLAPGTETHPLENP